MRKLSFAVLAMGLIAVSLGGGCKKEGSQLTIAVMPKSKGNAYFIACRKGRRRGAEGAGRN